MATEDSPDDVAAQWVARKDRSPLPPQEEHALKQWINADIRHKGAFLRAQAIWQATNKARALQTPTPIRIPVSAPIVHTAPAPSRRVFLWSAAAAASFGLLVVASKTGEASARYTTLKDIRHCHQGAGRQLVLDCYTQVDEYSELTSIRYGRCFITRTQRAVKTSRLRFVINGSLLLYKDANYESAVVIAGHAAVQGGASLSTENVVSRRANTP